ncbi:TetR/AcrR family transcriptional regulator [Oceanicola sp. 22II-s10i]|uniref:TetR/AcrR family transcriptional regulator n=1 Tax=Oceanicola sp. 22II-s10i TaxID=1317116 RepID=UPI000B52355C|nr:TetR/AcrR family transcriptional regulator [Oceanicola sp. 22II-s10i]
MTTATGDDRRRQIVEGAFAALQARGLPHLSYDAIAEQAGLTRQLVRYHYPDPDSLMLELCDMMAAIYRDVLISTAGSLSGPARVDAFLDFYFDMLDGTVKPRDDKVYDALVSLSAGSEAVRIKLGDQYRLIGQVLSHEFSVQFPDLDHQAAEELSWLFVCLMYGHWKMVASLGFDDAHRTISRQAMDRLIRSYCDHRSDPAAQTEVWRRRASES